MMKSRLEKNFKPAQLTLKKNLIEDTVLKPFTKRTQVGIGNRINILGLLEVGLLLVAPRANRVERADVSVVLEENLQRTVRICSIA